MCACRANYGESDGNKFKVHMLHVVIGDRCEYRIQREKWKYCSAIYIPNHGENPLKNINSITSVNLTICQWEEYSLKYLYMSFNRSKNIAFDFVEHFSMHSCIVHSQKLFGMFARWLHVQVEVIANCTNVKTTTYKVCSHWNRTDDVRETNVKLNEPQQIPSTNGFSVKRNRDFEWSVPCRRVIVSNGNTINWID